MIPDDPIVAGATIAQTFRSAREADAAVARLRAVGFADVRLSERAGTTREAHVPASAGLTSDDFSRTLMQAGFTASEATGLTRAAADGRIVVTVVAGERVAIAAAVLRGEKVGEHPVGPVDAPPLVGGDQVVALRAEQLDVATEATTSEARVRRETIVEEKTITVPVRREELVIEQDGAPPYRVPVGGDGPVGTR